MTVASARLRAAVYDPDGRPRAIVTGVQATVEANTPPGGSWRELPPGVRRLKDVAPLAPAQTPPPAGARS